MLGRLAAASGDKAAAIRRRAQGLKALQAAAERSANGNTARSAAQEALQQLGEAIVTSIQRAFARRRAGCLGGKTLQQLRFLPPIYIDIYELLTGGNWNRSEDDCHFLLI